MLVTNLNKKTLDLNWPGAFLLYSTFGFWGKFGDMGTKTNTFILVFIFQKAYI